MAEDLFGIRKDLKDLEEKVEDRFGKVEARLSDIILDLQKVVNEVRETVDLMRSTELELKSGEQDQQLESEEVGELDGGQKTVDIKHGRRPRDFKQRSGVDEEERETKKTKMAAKGGRREENIQKYFVKKYGDEIPNRQNEFREHKIRGQWEEQNVNKGKKIDQKKRRRSEGTDRENEKGECRGGIS